MSRPQVLFPVSLFFFLMAGCAKTSQEEPGQTLTIDTQNLPSLSHQQQPAPAIESFQETTLTFADGHKAKAHLYHDESTGIDLFFSLTDPQAGHKSFYPYNSYVAWLKIPSTLASLGQGVNFSMIEQALGEPLSNDFNHDAPLLTPIKVEAVGQSYAHAPAIWHLYPYQEDTIILNKEVMDDKSGFFRLATVDLALTDELKITLLSPILEKITLHIKSLPQLVKKLKSYPQPAAPALPWHNQLYLRLGKAISLNPLYGFVEQHQSLTGDTGEAFRLAISSINLSLNGEMNRWEVEKQLAYVKLYSSKPLEQMHNLFLFGVSDATSNEAFKVYTKAYEHLFKKHRRLGLQKELLSSADQRKLAEGLPKATFFKIRLTDKKNEPSESPWFLAPAPQKDTPLLPDDERLALNTEWLRAKIPDLDSLESLKSLELYYIDHRQEVQSIRFEKLFLGPYVFNSLYTFAEQYRSYLAQE